MNPERDTQSFEEFTPEELLGPLNEVEKKNAPRRLFIAGDRGLLHGGPRVSIVGSRKASAGGISGARGLAKGLVARGAVVVSGLAEGIDTAAHEGAIEAGGRTIAVLGTPLDEAFPAKNRALQALIMREHLAVSQFASGVPSQRGNFPMRNRTMALLSDATAIVEAGEGSGSLHQGWEALRLGRPLFLSEALLGDASLSWPGEMERYGAQGLALENLELLFEFLPERARGGSPELAF
ncbi:MAG TPA: DNA-processing protein DprA [Candidatus Eisenbacteria bacterium]|jgi:DNA processing protein